MEKLTFLKKDIKDLIDLIHDQKFDVNKIKSNKDAKTLEIEFRRRLWEKEQIVRNYFVYKKKIVPVTKAMLRICNMNDFKIVDKEHIGFYEFNVLEYAEQSKEIKILAEPKFCLLINVSSFLIEIDLYNEVIDEEKHNSILFIET